MADIQCEIENLRDQDENVALVLEKYKEIEDVYQKSLEAMGLIEKVSPSAMNSANLTMSFSESISSLKKQVK